jgi:hypothetical protein
LRYQPATLVTRSTRTSLKLVAGVTVGPITKSCFEMMAAKFGFAIHYDKTGVIVPPGGAVEVRFRTNLELHETSLPAA